MAPAKPRSPVTGTRKKRSHADDLRGVSRLAIDATERVTHVVEAMHNTIASGPSMLGEPLARPVRHLNGLIYGSIRAVTRLVGMSIERGLSPLVSILGESTPGVEREAVLAALNGVVGDYLVETKNPLAIPMRLRQGGHPLPLDKEALRAALPHASSRLLVLIHGSSMNDLQWKRHGHDHGAALARELGYTPLYVHYNSGVHVSTNGRELDSLLEHLVTQWPVPVHELVLLCHSMGGLVARSACHYGEAHCGRAWRRKLSTLICLGTPHHGAPLERGGNWIDALLGKTRYSAPLARLGKLRSAGVTDLRFGNVLDEHWMGRDRFEHGIDAREAFRLPEGVACYAIAGNRRHEKRTKLSGDGLVPVASAFGHHERAGFDLKFPESHQWVAHGVSHLDLLSDAGVSAKLREWLSRTTP